MTTTPVLTKTAAVALRALERAGAMTGSELRNDFGEGPVKRAVARGDIVRLFPDVYCARAHASDLQVKAQAASLWADAPVSGRAALYLWGLLDEPPGEIELLVSHGRHIRAQPGVKIRQSTVDLPQAQRQGVRVTSPAASIVSAYGRLPKRARADMFYGAIRRRIATPTQIRMALDTLPRVKARRALLRSVRAAEAGAQSYLEEKALYSVFNTAEFSQFVRQREVVIEGNQFFLDMFDPATKLALELDGRNGHLDEFRQKNITRDAWVASIGIQTLRFSYWDLMQRPEWCRQIVREVVRIRKLQMAGFKRP